MDPLTQAILDRALTGGVPGGIGQAGMMPIQAESGPPEVSHDVTNFLRVANDPSLTPPGPTYGGGSSMIKPAFAPGGGSQDTWMLMPNFGIGID